MLYSPISGVCVCVYKTSGGDLESEPTIHMYPHQTLESVPTATLTTLNRDTLGKLSIVISPEAPVKACCLLRAYRLGKCLKYQMLRKNLKT